MIWTSDVWSELDQMRRDMLAFAEMTGVGGSYRYSFPRLNIYENRDAFSVAAELPGVARDKVEIRIADNTLTLSGERVETGNSEKARFLRQEREFGKFEKVYRFPLKVNAEAATAKLENGILLLHAPKAEEAKPKQIAIQA